MPNREMSPKLEVKGETKRLDGTGKFRVLHRDRLHTEGTEESRQECREMQRKVFFLELSVTNFSKYI